MKKKLLSILVIQCMILSLAACGSAPKAEPDENGNYVETTSETNKDSSSPLIAENLQKCIISGMEIFDIANLSNEIE